VTGNMVPLGKIGDNAKTEPGWKWWLSWGDELEECQYVAVRVCHCDCDGAQDVLGVGSCAWHISFST